MSRLDISNWYIIYFYDLDRICNKYSLRHYAVFIYKSYYKLAFMLHAFVFELTGACLGCRYGSVNALPARKKGSLFLSQEDLFAETKQFGRLGCLTAQGVGLRCLGSSFFFCISRARRSSTNRCSVFVMHRLRGEKVITTRCKSVLLLL